MPHEQGAWALLCVSGGAGEGADGGRPTSRGLPPAARGATLPCPGGARGAAGMRERRCLPRWGKGAAVWRAWFWRVYGKKYVAGRSTFQEGQAGAPGGRGEWSRRAFAGDGTRLHPGKAFRVIHPWRTRRSPPSACGENRPPALPASATFPQPSRGRPAGSARTRSRNQSLENPIGCRVASQCCNESRAAPTHGPPGGLRTLPQSKTQQRTPAP